MKLLKAIFILALICSLQLHPSAGQAQIKEWAARDAKEATEHSKTQRHVRFEAAAEYIPASVGASPACASMAAQKKPFRPLARAPYAIARNSTTKKAELVAPIPDLQLAGKSKDEKIALFEEATEIKDTKRMYHLIHDPDIAAFCFDAKTFKERPFADPNSFKSMLTHGIDNNDVPFVAQYVQLCPAEVRQRTIAYAARHNRPHLVAALMQQHPPQSLHTTLQNHLNIRGNESLCYQEAHELLMDASKDQMEKQFQEKCTRYQAGLDEATQKTMDHQGPNRGPKIFSNQTLRSTLLYLLPSGRMDPKLEAAIIKGKTADAQRLIGEGRLELFSENTGYHALKLAVRYGQPEVVKSIAANSRHLNHAQRQSLIWIARLEIAKTQKHDPKAHAKIIQNYQKIIRFFAVKLPLKTMAKNANLRRRNFTLMLSHLQHGANPNATVRLNNKKYPILPALINAQRPAHARLLIKYGANVNALNGDGFPIPWQALHYDDTQYLEMLLQNNADPNILVKGPDGKDYPLLIHAFAKQRFAHAKILFKYADASILFNYAPQLLKTFLQNGLDPNTVINGPDGLEPLLYYAIKLKRLAHARLLVQHGADVNVSVGGGYPISFDALIAGHQFLELLLENKADPNAKMINIETNTSAPLLYYALSSPCITQMLIKYGADRNALDEDGHPIAWKALRSENPEIVQLFFADPNTKEYSTESSGKITIYPYLPF